jgi:alpha-L-rhamnosidase
MIAKIMPIGLKCEYAINPLGIDVLSPRLSWVLESHARKQAQTAYQILVATNLELLHEDAADMWDSGKVASDESIHIAYGGKALKSYQRCFWKVRVWDSDGNLSEWSEPAFWEMGVLYAHEWAAKWIAADLSFGDTAPLFRKSFQLDCAASKARAYICGLGYYELYINGRRVGDHVLDPAQTDYEERAFYVAYDVTDYLLTGENVVGVMLGNGWFNQSIVWGGLSYGEPRIILQMRIETEDDHIQMLATDEAWKVAEGPIISNNVYAGEVYDARQEHKGWYERGFNDRSWGQAFVVDTPTRCLCWQAVQPIKRMQTLQPVAITNPKPAVYVYDMGQNFAGWARLKISAPAGTEIKLRFAETVGEDGMIDPASTGVFATNVVQTDIYICNGNGLEVWEPHFTYHGFRYVEMTGYPGEPGFDKLEGVVVHTAVEKTGHFECSDEMLNRIHKTALWTQISNLHGIPTDCPHRERCGWLGDAHVSAEMTIYNFDIPRFWTKFVEDIETSAITRGFLPMIAPGKRTGGKASPDWGTAVVQLPWYLYLYYGDTRILLDHYETMKRWLEHLREIAERYIISIGLGDWCPPGSVEPTETPIALTSTAYFYFDTIIMAEVAQKFGKESDARDYRELAGRIKQAFNDQFFDVMQATYGSQTANCFALYLGLVPKGYEEAVAASLACDVLDKHSGHHSTGITGSRHLYWVLGCYGYGDIAQTILHQTTYPSIGYLFSLGATTFWETWGESDIDEKWGPRSLNHPMQGGFDAWFYQGIAGINPIAENPGFKHIVLQPQLIGDLIFAQAEYESIRGKIVSEWRRRKGVFEWKVSIPANTTATVYIPTADFDHIMENGTPVEQAEGVLSIKTEDEYSLLNIGSGTYNFTVLFDTI